MNKKGFTLIELLAAVAILALLVVILIPNVTKLYNDAKKNVFVNECKNIYKSARSSYVYDNVESSEPFAYGNGIENNGNVQLKKLDLDGSQSIAYVVQFDNEGNIIYFYANNGTYEMEKGQINVVGSPILIEDISEINTIETPYENPGDKVVVVEDPDPDDDEGGQIVPLDPSYDPDDPDDPGHGGITPIDPGSIVPITPGGKGTPIDHTVSQRGVNNNSCPTRSGYTVSQSGNNIIVNIYFVSALGNPTYSLTSVTKFNNNIYVNAKTEGGTSTGEYGITMMKCTVMTVTITDQVLSENNLTVQNGLVIMNEASFGGGSGGSSTY